MGGRGEATAVTPGPEVGATRGCDSPSSSMVAVLAFLSTIAPTQSCKALRKFKVVSFVKKKHDKTT